MNNGCSVKHSEAVSIQFTLCNHFYLFSRLTGISRQPLSSKTTFSHQIAQKTSLLFCVVPNKSLQTPTNSPTCRPQIRLLVGRGQLSCLTLWTVNDCRINRWENRHMAGSQHKTWWHSRKKRFVLLQNQRKSKICANVAHTVELQHQSGALIYGSVHCEVHHHVFYSCDF